jgi:hexosaminidase
MFWGDVCVDHPNLIRGLPADFVVASWCYEPKSDYAKWIAPFRDAKLDLIVCPGLANWNRVFPNLDVALPNIRDFTRDGRRAGAIGALTCAWSDNGDAPFDLNWYALAGGAAASWQEAPLDTTHLHRAFDWVLFRSPGTDAAEAIDLMQQDHRLVMSVRRHDANLVLYWQNPLSSTIDRRQLASLEPRSSEIRLNAERAIERLARARATARRNADMLDTYAFAARRLHAIGLRAWVAKRVPELYRDIVAKATPGSTIEAVRATLGEINGILVEGRNCTTALAAEHERLWLRENRPYWLGNIRALYDRDAQAWLSVLDVMRQVEIGLRLGVPPPSPNEVGLGP